MQIDLYEDAGEHAKESSEDAYDTALAYLTVGYTQRRPQMVRTAHKLLTLVKQDSESSSNTDIGE